jgi:O-antigen/teichoic acid export membrane protein
LTNRTRQAPSPDWTEATAAEATAAEAEAKASGLWAEPGAAHLSALQWLRSRVIRRLSWGIADQIVSSLTNFAVGIYIVHTLGAVQFGVFSLAYVTYGFALNASRGLSTDPLMVRFSGTDRATWRRATRDCTGTALVVGLVSGALVLAAARLLNGTAAPGFVALGLTLPGLMLQDSWRYSFFALGRGVHAFLNDTIWAVTLLPALVLLRDSGRADVFWFTLAWGATGTVAAAAGPFQARLLPRIAGTWRWVATHRDLGFRYLLEGTANNAVNQVRGYGVGVILGLAAVGYLQASITLMGPMTILFLGMSLVTIPEGARALRRSHRHLRIFCVLVSAGLTAAEVGWGLILLVLVPRGLGSGLLGPIWRETYPLVLPMIFFLMGQAVGSGAGTGLHALGAAKRSLRYVLTTAAIGSAFTLGGALVGGVLGAAVGMAIGSWIAAFIAWWQFLVALHEHEATTAGRLQRHGSAREPRTAQ